MKLLNNKLLIEPIKLENEWNYEDKDEVKSGKLAFDFESKEEKGVKLKKGDEVYYQYPTSVKINGETYDLVSESNLICLK